MKMIPLSALLLLGALASPALLAAPATAAISATDWDGHSHTLTAAQLQGLDQGTLTVTIHGTTLTCQGPRMDAVLTMLGVPMGKAMRGAALAATVDLRARDNHRVTLAASTFDPGISGRESILAHRCNGKLLDAHAGPWRLLIQGDVRPARWIRQVHNIVVHRAWSE